MHFSHVGVSLLEVAKLIFSSLILKKKKKERNLRQVKSSGLPSQSSRVSCQIFLTNVGGFPRVGAPSYLHLSAQAPLFSFYSPSQQAAQSSWGIARIELGPALMSIIP